MPKHKHNDLNRTMSQFRFDYKWIKQTLVGRGAFGQVYVYLNIETKETVAVKVETLIMRGASSLQREYQVYCHLISQQMDITNYRGARIPSIYWFGENEGHKVLVMQHLGPSLQQLRRQSPFSLPDVCRIAEDLLFLLEEIHTQGFYHGDIKAANVLTGLPGNEHVTYLVDFGCAFKMTPAQQTISGTRLGHRASRRRVDLIALLEMLLVLLPDVFLPGSIARSVNREGCIRFSTVLQDFHGRHGSSSHDHYTLAVDEKVASQMEQVCQFFPEVFLRFGQYVLELEAHHMVDFEYLRSLIRSLGNPSAELPLAEPNQLQPENNA